MKPLTITKTNLENFYLGSADGRDVYMYRNSKTNPLSIYVISDEYFDVGEAWDTLMEVYPEAGYVDIDFIEFDKAVANTYNSKFAAVFHQYN
jgi:hypothetical protein